MPRARGGHRRRRAALHRRAHDASASSAPSRAPTAWTASTTEGTPLVNMLVDRYHEGGLLGARHRLLPRPRAARGRAPRCRRRPSGSPTARDLDRGDGRPDRRRGAPARSSAHTARRIARIDGARDEREAIKARTMPGAHAAQVRHRRDRQHLRRRRAGQGRARSPAPTSSRSSAPPRSRCSTTCPHGADHRGLRRHVRHAGELPASSAAPCDEASDEYGRYIAPDQLLVGPLHERRSPGWRRSSGSTCSSTTRCTGSSSATSTCAAPSSISTSRAGSSRAQRHRHQHRRRQLPHHRRRRGEGAHRARLAVRQRGVRQARRPPRGADGPRPRLRDQSVARGQLPPRDRAGAAHPPDLRPPPDQVDAAHQVQDRRHLPEPRARRDVQPRRRHHRPVDRAARHVQRGDPQPAADGSLPLAEERRATSSTRRGTSATRSQWKPGGIVETARARRCSTRRTSCSTRSSARRSGTAIGARRLRRREAHAHRRQGLRGRGRALARLREPVLDALEEGRRR